VLSRSSDIGAPRWAGLSLRLPARAATPVLVVSALLFGLAVGSAVFATLWRNETTSRQKTEQALAQEQARVQGLAAEVRTLRDRLLVSQRTASAAAQTAADRKALIAGLDRSAGSLLAASTPLQDQAAAITSRSQSLSSLIRTLDNDLQSLSNYVSGANGSNLDPAFLQAQLDYLKPALTNVGAAADALSSQANTYSTAVGAFVHNASAYASAAKDAAKH
jgi:chromosome segregation ATPase